ncbi:MAG: hypothetical protein F4Y16_00100 [Holophagales bacterium]|nr:hypothetical protein [Holophagales bacterium]
MGLFLGGAILEGEAGRESRVAPGEVLGQPERRHPVAAQQPLDRVDLRGQPPRVVDVARCLRVAPECDHPLARQGAQGAAKTVDVGILEAAFELQGGEQDRVGPEALQHRLHRLAMVGQEFPGGGTGVEAEHQALRLTESSLGHQVERVAEFARQGRWRLGLGTGW